MELTPRELRDSQLRTLDAIMEFCDDEGVRYYLAYGTLLGAARHGGYIPWDDDIDLMMPRDDYDRFCATFNKDAHQHEALSPQTHRAWPFPYAKVCDRRTVLVEAIDVDESLVFGVNVDVFPLDHYPQRRLRRTAQLAVTRFLVALHTLRIMTPRPGRARTKAAALTLAKFVLRRLAPASLARAVTWAAIGRGGQSTRWGIVVGSYAWSTERDAFGESNVLSFEERPCFVPTDYGRVLTAMYGPHYMEPPPLAERLTHHRMVASWA